MSPIVLYAFVDFWFGNAIANDKTNFRESPIRSTDTDQDRK